MFPNFTAIFLEIGYKIKKWQNVGTCLRHVDRVNTTLSFSDIIRAEGTSLHLSGSLISVSLEPIYE